MVEIDERKRKLIIKLAEFLDNRRVNVLDVGCGDCRYKHVFNEYLKMDRYIGMDKINKCSDAGVIITDLEDIAIDNYPMFFSFFDVVVLFDILEHLTNYGNLLKWVNRVLKSDGYILITTISIPLDNINDAIESDPEHVHLYTPTLLSRALNRYNLKPIYSTQDNEILFMIASKQL